MHPNPMYRAISVWAAVVAGVVVVVAAGAAVEDPVKTAQPETG